jgi:ABC-type dipeptide/oligopeptide/nickel transport system permease component/ABC-type transport system substrate-binding protein
VTPLRLLCLVLAAWLWLGAGAARADGAITLGLQLEPPILDPTAGAAAAIDDVAFGTVFEGLVKLGPGGRVDPRLATGWRVSDDGLVWRFDLRRNVRFHDGAPFDAQAVKASLDRARADGSTNAERARLSVIREIVAVDPHTIELRLARRSSGLLQVLGWGDAAIVRPNGADAHATKPVGTGPFRFVGWRRGDSVTLERNPDWWGPTPSLERVTFRFIADPSAALAALNAGDIDGYGAFPAPESVARLRRDARFTVQIGPTEGETILALNQRSGPLADVRVRRALSHAIDRRAIIKGAMFGLGEPMGSHYPPQNPGYVDLTAAYPHDPARARTLLAEAGYEAGFDLTIKLPPLPYARRSGEVIASQLAQVGVRARLQEVEWAPWLDQVFGRNDFQATIVSHVEPADYEVYGRAGYYFGYDSAEMQSLLARIDDAQDERTRLALLGDVQRLIARDAVNVFLFQLPAIGVFNARVTDIWAPTPISAIDLTAADVVGGSRSDSADGGSGRVWLWVLAPLPALAIWLASRASPGYLVSRIGALALTLLAASVVVFGLVQLAPGDPARFMMGLSGDEAGLQALRAELGLDAPAWRRYLDWLAGALRGDFGVSYTYRVPVGGLIAERVAVSLPLTLYALLLSTTLAFAGGLWAAARPGGAVDTVIEASSRLGVAVPNFWFGMVLVLLFAGVLRWFSAGGFPGWEGGVGPALKALTLPALALALPQAAVLTRVLRSELLTASAADYVRTARAKGRSRDGALLHHALPNALVPVLTILGLQFSFLLAGAVIIENVFFLPGLGRLVFQAVTQRDLMVVQGVVMVLVFAVVATTFLVDLAYVAVDPRLRRGGS